MSLDCYQLQTSRVIIVQNDLKKKEQDAQMQGKKPRFTGVPESGKNLY